MIIVFEWVPFFDAGAANNQLADPVNGDVAIAAQGITYVPDFVANRMGIVNCANEAYGRVGDDADDDPAIARHLGTAAGPNPSSSFLPEALLSSPALLSARTPLSERVLGLGTPR